MFESIFTGLILCFGYYIYKDRMDNFRFDPMRCYSIACAYMGLMTLGVSLLTATKTSIWQYLINVPADRAAKFHKYASASSIAFLSVHTGLDIWFWGPDLMLNWDYTLVVGRAKPFAGVLGMCCLALVSLSSIPLFRNRYYGIFLGMHSWFFPGVLCCIYHYTDMGLFVLGPGVLLYLVDLFIRHLHSYKEPKVVARRLIGYEYVEVDVQFTGTYFFYEKNAVTLKGISTQFLKPSAWYYVCIPEVMVFVVIFISIQYKLKSCP